MKLEELQRELNTAKESKQVLESRLVSMEAEARAMSVKVGSLEVEVQKERALSEEIAAKCRELEEELSRKEQEVELQKTASSNGELKIKQVRHHLLLLTTYISSNIFYQLFAGYCRNISLPYVSKS